MMEMTINLLIATSLATLCCLATVARGDAETFSPSDVTDASGNRADADSVITWGAVPQQGAYRITPSNVDHDAGALSYLHTMVDQFLNAVFIKTTPYDAIKQALDGDFQIAEFGMYIGGYGVCVVVGFLFIIIMPITGCCFCCCRCAGNCGGSKVWKDKYEKNMVPCFICHLVSLFIITVFLFCGTALLYATNQETGKTVKNIGDIVSDNLNDGKTFVDNTVAEFRHVGSTNFNFTKNVINRDLNNVGSLVGVPVREKLRTDGNIDAALNAAYAIDNLITTLSNQLDAVDTQTSELQTNLDSLETDLNTVKTQLDAYSANANCDATCQTAVDSSNMNVGINTALFPNIATQKTKMNDVKNQNLTANIDQGKADFENIPQQVETDTVSVRNDMINKLDDFVTTIDDGLKDITKMSDDVNPELDSIQAEVDEYAGNDSYDKYRWYAMIGLSCVVLLIVLFNVLGLILGMCGFGRDPFQRSSASTCGSCFFITSVVLIFIFSWILMILCTLTFMIGAPMGGTICKEIKDPSYTIFKELLDGPDSVMDDDGIYPLAKVVLGSQHSGVALTYSGMLTGCKNNEPSWSVLKLNYRLNLNDITNYKKDVDIEAEVNSFSVDLSSVEFFDSDTETQLNDFKDAVDINYDQFITELNKDPCEEDLAAKAADMKALTISDSTLQAQITATANQIESINTGSYLDAENKRVQLLQSVQDMKASAATVDPSVDDVITKMQASENYIQTNGSDVITQQLQTFASREVAVADSYVAKVTTAIEDEIARCLPLYNFWHSLLINAFCDQVIGSFNTFWFSLGWCIFFMIPSLILSVKITKYLRQFNTRQAGSVPAKNQVSPGMMKPTF